MLCRNITFILFYMPIYVHRLINLHSSCESSKTGGSDFLGIAVLGLATIFQAPVPCYYVKSATA